MDTRLITLKLFLDELGLAPDISTVQDRKQFQKAVFLGQMADIDLGYRYGWYLMGPYSSSLTRDYYELDEALSVDNDLSTYSLNPATKAALAKIKPLFEVPKNVDLEKPEWLELLSSILFLKKVSKLKAKEIKQRIKEEKANLVAYIDAANDALKKMKLT